MELSTAQLGERARWRDNRLMALVAHQRQQSSEHGGPPLPRDQ